MKTYLLGFAVGALFSSSQWGELFLLTPFFMLYFSFISKAGFKFSVAVMLGMAWVSIHLFWVESNAVGVNVQPYKQVLEGRVLSVKGTSDRSGKLVFDFVSAESRLKVSCYRCPLVLKEGELWRIALRVRPFISLHNPNGFDYRQWMLAKGYSAAASVQVKSSDNKRLNSGYSGFASKSHVFHVLESAQVPILKALLLGDKSSMKAADRRLINQAGISHLFVVSGLHVSLAAFLFIFICVSIQRPFLIWHWRFSKHVGIALGIFFAGYYAYLSGVNTPAVRAFIMLCCAMALLWGKRNVPVFHYWLLALNVVLFVSPLAFFDMGAWLSFGIVLALIMGMSGLSLTGPVRPTLFFVDKKQVDAAGFKPFINVVYPYVHGVLKAQWFAFCVGAMILVAFFLPVSAFSLLLNLILIPMMSVVILPAALLSLFLALIFSQPSLLMHCEQAMGYILMLLHECSSLVTWSLPIHDENRYWVLLAFFLLILPRAMGLLPLAVCVLLIAFTMATGRPQSGGFTVNMLDVGQGSSAVIQTANHNVLVDTGYGQASNMGMVDYVVMPYLKQKNIRRLDLVHLTHDDADHAGGLNALTSMTDSVTRQSQCESKSWIWDGVAFEQFQSQGHKKGNNGTCLLKVMARGGDSLLFAGDIEKKAERSLLAADFRRLQAEVLVVPHHGSKSSSSSAFINAVNPDMALISAGRLNHFGHPHSEVLQRYRDRLVKIYSTASHGAVEVEFSPRQAARIVSTYRPKDSYE